VGRHREDARGAEQRGRAQGVAPDHQRALGGKPIPDGIVVLATAAGSGVICLELDEATQHAAPIRAKLGAYRQALAGRSGWHVLFVVPGPARAAWLRRVAVATDLNAVRVWTVARDDLRLAGADAPITSLTGTPATPTLHAAMVGARSRRSREPVANQAWIELLGRAAARTWPQYSRDGRRLAASSPPWR
jgi:hypothetical protein